MPNGVFGQLRRGMNIQFGGDLSAMVSTVRAADVEPLGNFLGDALRIITVKPLVRARSQRDRRQGNRREALRTAKPVPKFLIEEILSAARECQRPQQFLHRRALTHKASCTGTERRRVQMSLGHPPNSNTLAPNRATKRRVASIPPDGADENPR